MRPGSLESVLPPCGLGDGAVLVLDRIWELRRLKEALANWTDLMRELSQLRAYFSSMLDGRGARPRTWPWRFVGRQGGCPAF